MSKHRDIEVQCPWCEASGAFTIWESVNRDLDPAAAARLARGELLLHRCAACGKEAPVVYPLLLHAMKEQEMVQLLTDGAAAPDMGTAAAMLRTMAGTLWTVDSQNALMECARLYAAGLDRFAMLVLHERLRFELERSGTQGVKEVVFDSVDERGEEPRLVFAVLIADQPEPTWMTFGRAEWDAHVKLVEGSRARCIEAGKWTPWSRATAQAAVAVLSAGAVTTPT